MTCAAATVTDKQTTPPRRFTDAALIQAMTGIGRFVDDPQVRKLLKETDGIGTPATQAQIIQTLFERKFIEKRGRQVQSTAVGRALVQALPAVATRPDMTALWEAGMRRIADGHMSLAAFLDAVLTQIRELVQTGRSAKAVQVVASGGSAASPRARRRRRRDAVSSSR